MFTLVEVFRTMGHCHEIRIQPFMTEMRINLYSEGREHSEFSPRENPNFRIYSTQRSINFRILKEPGMQREVILR